MSKIKKKKKNFGFYPYLILFLAVTFIIYLPATDYEFVWDDTDLYLNESQFYPGMDFSDYLKFWDASTDKMYMPVTYSVWTVAYIMSGKPPVTTRLNQMKDNTLSPALFHWLNIVFHLLNGILLFYLTRNIIKSDIASVAGAALFLLHPVQIESVAWVSELRGLLAAFFGLLSIIFYMRYVETTGSGYASLESHAKNSISQYIFCIAFLILSLLSKPSSIVVPLMLILIDYFHYRRGLKAVLKSTVILVLLTIPIMLRAKLAESNIPQDFGSPLWARPFVFFDSVAFYLYKIFLPIEQIADYSHRPILIMQSPWFYISWIVTLTLIIMLWINKNKVNVLLMSFLIFIAGFLPLSGLVSFYFQDWSTVADRYIYLSMMSVSLAFAFSLERIKKRKYALIITGVISLIFVILVCSHLPAWKNEFSLWNDVISKNPEHSAHAYNGRGYYFLESGKYHQALEDFNKAISINPNYGRVYYNRGSVYLDLDKINYALADFTKAISLNLNNPNVYVNRAIAYSKLGLMDSALIDYSKALVYDKRQPDVYVNRGIIYAEQGMLDEAIKEFRTALKLEPNDELASENLRLALELKRGKR